jgi:hypothetical protein
MSRVNQCPRAETPGSSAATRHVRANGPRGPVQRRRSKHKLRPGNGERDAAISVAAYFSEDHAGGGSSSLAALKLTEMTIDELQTKVIAPETSQGARRPTISVRSKPLPREHPRSPKPATRFGGLGRRPEPRPPPVVQASARWMAVASPSTLVAIGLSTPAAAGPQIAAASGPYTSATTLTAADPSPTAAIGPQTTATIDPPPQQPWVLDTQQQPVLCPRQQPILQPQPQAVIRS